MPKKYLRVAFVSNGDLGKQMRDWLQSLSICFIAWDRWDNVVPTADWNDDYDIGFNLLGTHKIPADQIRDGRRWINFHPAPLPEYGGRNVAYHAIMEGAKCFGATVHYMSPEFDTGDIIECVRFPILPSDTAGSIMEQAKAELVGMFKEWVPKLLKGPVPARSQKGETRYYHKQPIHDEVGLTQVQIRDIRALTCPPHCAKVVIAGKTYKIIPEE